MGLVMYLRCSGIINIWKCYAYRRYFMLSKNEPSILLLLLSKFRASFYYPLGCNSVEFRYKMRNIKQPLRKTRIYRKSLRYKALGHASHNLMGLWSISATGSIIKLWKLTVNFDSRPHGLCPGDKFKIIWCMPEDFIAREQIVLENELPIFRAQRSRFSINVSLIVWRKSSS